MKASRLPRPVGSSRLLPAFSPSELARKRLRHLSGSSTSSGSTTAAPGVPAKAQRPATPPPAPPHNAAARPPAERPLKSSTPAAVLQGIASADLSVPYPQLASLGARPKRGQPLPQPPTSAAAAVPVPPDHNTVIDDDEGFTLVTKKRSRGAAATSTPTTAPASTAAPRSSRPSVGVTRPPPRASEFPAFRVPVQEGFATSYDAVALLETNHAHLKLRNVAGRDGSSVLLPLDQESFSLLEALASDPAAAVTLFKLDANPQLTKGVVMGYPVRMPLTLLQRHPQVEEATRCFSTHRQQETRQVLISVRGSLPSQIDLGNWGVFYTRPYSPEPLRCYRCQRFGHHQASCSRPPTCGICSGPHHTQQCLDKYKANQETQPKCPNCSRRHHAWNPRCPARIQRVNSGREKQALWVQDQQRTTLTPAPPGTFVWGHQPKNLRPAPASTEEDFPPLQPPAQKSVGTQHSPPTASPRRLPSDTIAVTKTMLLDYANEISSAVAEVLIQSAGINIDLTAFQDIMASANERIVSKLFTSTRP